MIDVACFCGCSYSFEGDTGACPECGEPVAFRRGSDCGPQGKPEAPAQLSAPAGDAAADDLAA